FTWFNRLKNSERNSRFPASPRKGSLVSLTNEKFQFRMSGPRNIPRGAFPRSPGGPGINMFGLNQPEPTPWAPRPPVMDVALLKGAALIFEPPRMPSRVYVPARPAATFAAVTTSGRSRALAAAGPPAFDC